jgi:hypothetical protein
VASGEQNGATPQDKVLAVWRKVRISDHRPMDHRAMDCVLVQQSREELLPMFATRSIADRTHCRLAEVSAGNIDLQFEARQAPGHRRTGADCGFQNSAH